MAGDRSMSWVSLIWTVVPTVCVTLAVMHLLLWSQNRAARASMAFGITALGVAASAACELWMMRAASTGEYGRALRWMHVPAWVVIIALVAFVRLHLRAGRPWLAWSVFGLRSLALLLNFIFVPNLNFREITSLRHIPFLGEPVAVALGRHNPWMLVGQAGFLLLAIFVVDAFWTMLRRHDRRTAVVLAGTIVFFVFAGTLQVLLVLWGVVEMPLTTSLFFFGILLAMAYQMSSDLRRAAQLADDLRESEDRMRLAAEAAGFGVWVWNVASNVIWGSDRWLRLFEFSPDAPVSLERLLDRVHPDDRMMVARNVRHALVAKQDYAAEYRAVLPDGRLRWVSARGRVYADAAGKPVRMVGATLDVTERKRAEHKLVEQRSELVHMARVSAVGQLAASLAHELNQPLGAIMRNAEAGELFLNEPSPDLDEVRAILADIRKDDQRAGAVIDRMRSLMRRREVRHHPLDLSQMAGEDWRPPRTCRPSAGTGCNCNR